MKIQPLILETLTSSESEARKKLFREWNEGYYGSSPTVISVILFFLASLSLVFGLLSRNWLILNFAVAFAVAFAFALYHSVIFHKKWKDCVLHVKVAEKQFGICDTCEMSDDHLVGCVRAKIDEITRLVLVVENHVMLLNHAITDRINPITGCEINEQVVDFLKMLLDLDETNLDCRRADLSNLYDMAVGIVGERLHGGSEQAFFYNRAYRHFEDIGTGDVVLDAFLPKRA